MKQLIGTSCNMLVGMGKDNEPVASIELILHLMEPEYALDMTGSLTKFRKLDCVRVACTVEALTKIVGALAEYIEEAAELEEQTKFSPPQADATPKGPDK